MKVGDTKQASILSIVALAVVGFAIYRAIPTPPKFAPPPPEDAAPVIDNVTLAGTTEQLDYDPFVLLDLPEKPQPKKGQESEDDRQQKKSSSSELKLPNIPRADATESPVNPFGNPDDSKAPVTPEQSIRLVAVLGMDEMTALISIDGAAPISCKAGTRAGMVVVMKVFSTSVVLSGPKGKLVLPVGDEAKL